MLQEFQKILQTPEHTEQNYLKKVQDTMLNTMQHMLPQDFDFGQLATIFQKQSQNQNLASLTYKLTEYFVRIINQNFINLQSYFSLQQQTQKLQSTIRGHIKMQQQMKMYLQHLEYKIQRYEYHLKKLRKKQHENIQSSNQLRQSKQNDAIQHLKKRQTQLLKQRLVLLRKVDHLERRLKDQQHELMRINSPTSATIQQIKDGLIMKQKQVEGRVKFANIVEVHNKTLNQNIDRRMSLQSFGSDNQVTRKKTSIPINTMQNIRLYPLTGKDSDRQVDNIPFIQFIDTRNDTPFIESYQNIQLQNNNSPIKILGKVQ